MREILFRGKRLDDGEWVEGHLIQYEDGRARICGSHTDIFCYEKDRSIIQTVAHEVDPHTVGQFTGLTDKNGKRIFEGDILTLRTGIPYVVRFEDGAFFFENTGIPSRFANIFTVIGNIHDNPELLEAPNA